MSISTARPAFDTVRGEIKNVHKAKGECAIAYSIVSGGTKGEACLVTLVGRSAELIGAPKDYFGVDIELVTNKASEAVTIKVAGVLVFPAPRGS